MSGWMLAGWMLAALGWGLFFITQAGNSDLAAENERLLDDLDEAVEQAQAATQRLNGHTATPIRDMLARRHEEFARDLAAIHKLDEYRGQR